MSCLLVLLITLDSREPKVVALLGLMAVALGTLYLVSRKKNVVSKRESHVAVRTNDLPQPRESVLTVDAVPLKPPVLFVVLPADIDLIYRLKQGSSLTEDDCDTLYDRAESIWYGDSEDSDPIINMINSSQFNVDKHSENDVVIVKFQLAKTIDGFERDSLKRYEAYLMLKDSLKGAPIVSERLTGISYGPLKMFYRR